MSFIYCSTHQPNFNLYLSSLSKGHSGGDWSIWHQYVGPCTKRSWIVVCCLTGCVWLLWPVTKEAGILQGFEYKNKKQIIHKFHCWKCEEIYNKRAAFPGFIHLSFASCRIAHCTLDSILLGWSMQTVCLLLQDRRALKKSARVAKAST